MIKRKIILLFLCVNFLFSGELKNHAQVQEAIKLLETWLEAQKDYFQLPGLSMAVVHDQELLWSGGYGFSTPKEQMVSSDNSIHSICSISKLFTAIALMQLRDQGKLRLDDPVSKHLSGTR